MKNKTKSFTPRTSGAYGMVSHPMRAGLTCIESEYLCSGYGQFARRGLVRHEKTRELVRVSLDIPDTWFSIPAVTKTEHGFITSREDESGAAELLFVPHTDQTRTPAQFRKDVRASYK
jgi:hypothetical protein